MMSFVAGPLRTDVWRPARKPPPLLMLLLMLLLMMMILADRAQSAPVSDRSTATVATGHAAAGLLPPPPAAANCTDERSGCHSDAVAGNETDGRGHGEAGGHGPPQRFQVLTFDFDKVFAPFTISCWILAASIAKIGFHFSNKLSSVFPESSLLILLGTMVGIIFYFAMPGKVYHHMSANTFFYFLLPPIILESGYFMPNRAFFDNIGTILLYAVLGTLFNTITIGFSLWGVAYGLAGGESSSHLPTRLLHCLVFSSLISAVDPVAVLAVFEEIHVNEVLHIVVFGESLLNDAVTVVLYHMFETYSHIGEENIQVIDIVAGIAAFVVVGLGGTIIGVVFGVIAVFITRFTSHVRVIEPIFVFLLAYLSYLFAEMFHFSGIMALTFCGIIMKQYVEFNISEKSQTTVKYFMKMLSSMSETIIFMFLGTSTVADSHSWDVGFIISTVILCLVYRAIGVLLLTAIANRKRLIKLTIVDQFVMAYGGLRGAVAFALAITLDAAVIPAKNLFVTTTIVVVLFTVFIQGMTIKPLVNKLRVKKQEKRQLTMNEQINERLIDHLMAGVEDITGFHGDNWLRDKFEYYDNKYLKKFLLREQPKTRETGILRVSSKLSLRDAMEQLNRPSTSMTGSGTLVAAQFNLLNEPSLTKIIRNWSNVSLHDEGATNNDPGAAMAETANGTVIDMQALEATYSKKMADDSKIHHILSDNMIRLRKRWTKRKRHELDDIENHPPFHHTVRLHLRHMISQHERKQRERRSSSKRTPAAATSGRGEPAAAATADAATAATGLLVPESPTTAVYCRAKNVTFCDLATAEQPGQLPSETKDPPVKFHVPTFDVKPPDDDEDFGITFKAKDDDFYPDDPPPSLTAHVLPWRQGSTAAAGEGGHQQEVFASQLLLASVGSADAAHLDHRDSPPSFARGPALVAAELHASASSSVLPWRLVDDSTPELSHRAQSDLPQALHEAAAVRTFLDSSSSGSSESEESSSPGRSQVAFRLQPPTEEDEDSSSSAAAAAANAHRLAVEPQSRLAAERGSTSTLQESSSSAGSTSLESVVSVGRTAGGGTGDGTGEDAAPATASLRPHRASIDRRKGGGEAGGGGDCSGAADTAAPDARHSSRSPEQRLLDAAGDADPLVSSIVRADEELPAAGEQRDEPLRTRIAADGALGARNSGSDVGWAAASSDDDGDDEDDLEADESTPLACRLRRAKNSFEALHSRLLREKHNDEADEQRDEDEEKETAA